MDWGSKLPLTFDTSSTYRACGHDSVDMYARLFAPSLAWSGSPIDCKTTTGLDMGTSSRDCDFIHFTDTEAGNDDT